MNTSTLTKIEAVRAVSTATNQPQAIVETLVEAFLKQIEVNLSAGRRVEFRGFGIWEVRMSKERIGRNPKRPEAGDVKIPSRPVIRFKVGKDLKSAVQAGQAAPAATVQAVPVA